MSLSVSVMHVPDVAARRASLTTLLRGLGNSADVEVIKDTRRIGVWPMARRAWLSAGRGGVSHHLLLQDDALPCADLVATCELLAGLAPESPICLFDMSKATKDAVAAGTNWVARSSLSSSLGLIMPVDLAHNAVRWADQNVIPSLVHDDVRFSMYFQAIGRLVMLTAPSLVEHVGDESLVGNPRFLPGRKERRASLFIGAGVSGLSIDWAATVKQPLRGWSHAPREYEAYRIR